MKHLLLTVVLALGGYAPAAEPTWLVSPDCPCGPSCDCAPCNCLTQPVQFRQVTEYRQVCDGVTCRLVPVTVTVVDPPAAAKPAVEVKQTVTVPATLPLPMAGPGPTTHPLTSWVSAHRPHLFARLRAGVAGALFRGMP